MLFSVLSFFWTISSLSFFSFATFSLTLLTSASFSARTLLASSSFACICCTFALFGPTFLLTVAKVSMAMHQVQISAAALAFDLTTSGLKSMLGLFLWLRNFFRVSSLSVFSLVKFRSLLTKPARSCISLTAAGHSYFRLKRINNPCITSSTTFGGLGYFLISSNAALSISLIALSAASSSGCTISRSCLASSAINLISTALLLISSRSRSTSISCSRAISESFSNSTNASSTFLLCSSSCGWSSVKEIFSLATRSFAEWSLLNPLESLFILNPISSLFSSNVCIYRLMRSR